MIDKSLERTMREIAALSAPCTTPAEVHSRLQQINGLARQWLTLAEATKRDKPLIDRWLALQEGINNG